MYKHFIRFDRRRYSTIRNVTISSILECKNVGDQVQVKGWVKSLRKMKANFFFDVGDGSCSKKLQVLLPRSQKLDNLSVGSSVIVDGVLNDSSKGQLELHANNVKISGECVIGDGYPFAPRKSYAPEYIRQYLHLRPRTNKFSSLLRVRDAAASTIHSYFHENGYVQIHTPILTSNDCEGAGETFTVIPEHQFDPKQDYFDCKVYLTVSGQLHLEAAAHSLSKVYTLGPTFRAENSKSRLHLSEFYMLETECAFLSKLEELRDIIEDSIKTVTKRIMDKCSADVEGCREGSGNFAWLDKDFVVLTYNEAVSILNENKCNFITGNSFTKEHENILVNYCGGVPTFVVRWPKNIKPFYMKNCMDDDSKVDALDLLVPDVGELVGGSLREDNYDILRQKIPSHDGKLNWYLEIRKFGGVPTGGFGLGFERYLQLLLGISNIKDTIPFPRWPHNCKL